MLESGNVYSEITPGCEIHILVKLTSDYAPVAPDDFLVPGPRPGSGGPGSVSGEATMGRWRFFYDESPRFPPE